jgi:hypothetical protein
MADKRQRLLQVAVCISCAVATLLYSADLGDSEFGAGRLTSRILGLSDIGTLLFLVASLLAFFLKKTAAGIALTASVLCLPLYLYSLAPGPFRSVFRGEYSVPFRHSFEWDKSSVVGICLLMVALFICTRGLSSPRTKTRQENP